MPTGILTKPYQTNIMKNTSVVLCFFLSVAACGQNRQIPQSLSGVKFTVAKLDSAVTSMYGWEPKDSTYNTAIDTLVAGIVNDYEKNNPNAETTPDHSISQDAYDESKTTWSTFKRLCDADKYQEALDFYFGEDPKTQKKNAGDFLVFMKHSTHRFVFYTEVLKPLLQEFKGNDSALKEYIELLQFEKVMEDFTIALSEERNGYIPETYPHVLVELGSALVAAGKMNEAQDLFGDYLDAQYRMTGDALYANFAATYYAAHLYIQDDKPVWALGTWDNFLDYLEENKSDYNSEELAICRNRIENEKAKIIDMIPVLEEHH